MSEATKSSLFTHHSLRSSFFKKFQVSYFFFCEKPPLSAVNILLGKACEDDAVESFYIVTVMLKNPADDPVAAGV
jgi:hypothetical protein